MNRQSKGRFVVIAATLSVLTLYFALRPARMVAEDGGYHQVENWAQLPEGSVWGVMSAVGVDSKDNVYAFKRSEPGEKEGAMTSKILVFDSHGKFLKVWGEKTFSSAHGLRLDRDGFVWITDKTGEQVFKYTTDGELLLTLGKKGVAGDNNSEDAFNGPSDAVIGKNGEVFVSDGESTNTRVVKYSKEGKFIKFWGTKGAGEGQLDLPHNIAMDSKGRIYVADRTNKRVQVFDQDGKYLDQMTQFGTPSSIFITRDDMMYVAASNPENRVTFGTTDGKVMGKIDGLNGPHWVAVDSTGAVYVAEVGGQSLLKFVKQ